MSDIDPATLNQLAIDRAEAAYDEQCWREDRDELHGWNEHPTLEEFQQHMADAKKASQELTPPDDVDVILQQEWWEQTGDYQSAIRDWMTVDAATLDFAADRFLTSVDYDRAFKQWIGRRTP